MHVVRPPQPPADGETTMHVSGSVAMGTLPAFIPQTPAVFPSAVKAFSERKQFALPKVRAYLLLYTEHWTFADTDTSRAPANAGRSLLF
jgi:hypothetical protein